MTSRSKARADLAAGVVLFTLAVAVVAGSWGMDRLEARGVHPLSAPGFTPGLLGIALAVTSAMLVVRAMRAGGAGGWSLGTLGSGLSPATIRLFAALALSLFYALVLVGLLPFWLATAIYVAAFVAAFEWSVVGHRWANLAWAVGIGVATGLVVSYAFSELFLVRLP